MMRCLKVQPRGQIPTLHHNDDTYTSPTEKATALNRFFVLESQKSVGEPNEPVPDISTQEVNDNHLLNLETTPEEVESLLPSLDATKSAGDDGIPTLLLKVTYRYIAKSLAHIFNLSLAQGDLPQTHVAPSYRCASS